MRVIVLASGQSRRYQEAGYKIPKPFLKIEWRGCTEPMLCHVLQSIPMGFTITVAIPDGYLAVAQQLTQNWKAIFVQIAMTSGPAHTLQQTLQKENKPDFLAHDSLLILDVDVINHTNDLYTLGYLNSSAVLVSHSSNPAHSYVTNLGSFFHIKEKKLISPYAVRGAYYITSSDMPEFIQRIDDVVIAKQEPFISHALDALSTSKFAMKTTYDPIDWGTPLDVELSNARIITE